MAVSRIVKILFLIYLLTSFLLSPLLCGLADRPGALKPSVGDRK